LMSSGVDYHGILIREGIQDQTVLDDMPILGRKTGKKWTLLKIRVEQTTIVKTVRLIQANLLSENGVPYYAHFYRDEESIVVFPERAFHISSDRNSWNETVSYGESLGVPRAELDFTPCRFQDETF
jgi:hypothetical protein